MRTRWKLIGLAGLTGVAATGVVLARKRRAQRHYQPDELRDRLHRRLAEVSAPEFAAPAPAAANAEPSRDHRRRARRSRASTSGGR
jgi:hypothetical protein